MALVKRPLVASLAQQECYFSISNQLFNLFNDIDIYAFNVPNLYVVANFFKAAFSKLKFQIGALQ